MRACSISTACSRRRRRCTRRPGSRCSTSSCARAPSSAASRSSRSTRSRTTSEYVDGKPRYDGVRVLPGRARHRAAGGRRARPAGGRDGPRPGHPQERDRARDDPARTASRPTRARSSYVRAVRARGHRAAAVVSSSSNAHEVLAAAGIEELFDAVIDGMRRRARAPARQARAGHVPGGRACARRRSRARRPCSRTRSPGCRPAARATSAASSGVDRLGQAEALRAHGADVVVAISASCCDAPMIQHPGVPGRALVAARDRARPRPPGADASRCSRSPTGTSACAATSTRASRSGSPARISPASTSCARCRTRRRATATRRPARRSSTSPTASSSGCWSTTSRSTSATARCAATSACSTCGPACCAAASSGPRRRARGARALDAARVASRSARSPRSATRSSRSTGTLPVVVQSELVANEPLPASPTAIPRGRRLERPARRRSRALGARARARVLVHATRASGLRVAAAMEHVDRGAASASTSTLESARRTSRA